MKNAEHCFVEAWNKISPDWEKTAVITVRGGRIVKIVCEGLVFTAKEELPSLQIDVMAINMITQKTS